MRFFQQLMKTAVLLGLLCTLSVGVLADDKKKKDKAPVETVSFDVKQTDEYRKLLLIARNSQLTQQNTELQIQLAVKALDAQRQEAQLANQRALAFLADLAKAQGVAEDKLADYELTEIEGKFVLKLKKPDKQ